MDVGEASYVTHPQFKKKKNSIKKESDIFLKYFLVLQTLLDSSQTCSLREDEVTSQPGDHTRAVP